MSTFNPLSFGAFGPDGDVNMSHNIQPTSVDRWNACVYAITCNMASDTTKEAALQYIRDLKESHDGLAKTIRSIELCVDGLEMKGHTPKPAEKAALERIKAHCRTALKTAEALK